MTWTITIKAEENGLLVVSGISGEIPVGTYAVEGSDDGNRVRLAVRQHDAEGRFVTSAEHVLDRAEKALHEAEEAAQAITQAGGEAEVGVAVAGESLSVVREGADDYA
jgi:hypothetical protein